LSKRKEMNSILSEKACIQLWSHWFWGCQTTCRFQYLSRIYFLGALKIQMINHSQFVWKLVKRTYIIKP